MKIATQACVIVILAGLCVSDTPKMKFPESVGVDMTYLIGTG